MKKNNVLFIAMTSASVVLISAIIANNITSLQQKADLTITSMASGPQDALKTNAVRERFNRMGLVLHEGKYWKETHE